MVISRKPSRPLLFLLVVNFRYLGDGGGVQAERERHNPEPLVVRLEENAEAGRKTIVKSKTARE